MKKVKADFGNWYIEYLPEDRGRISIIKYSGHDLLTIEPENFTSPKNDYGEYEARPVYGYDDCFPTVDACKYPDGSFNCRDHGQLRWNKWQVKTDSNKLVLKQA